MLKKDLKSGFLTLKLENPDDAWKLESVLEEGDLVSGRTLRSTEVLRGDKKERTGKKPVFLKISLEKKEFHEYSGKLRLMGKVVEGPEEVIGSYHTFSAEEGKIVTIQKNWKKWQLDKIRKSMVKQPRILVCVMDEREATLAEVGERVRILAEISNKSAGKQFGESDSGSYFREIVSFLNNKSAGRVVIAGPGFAKDDLYKKIEEKEKKLFEKTITDSCSHTGETGIQELIKRGAVERAGRESRLSRETMMVEEFLQELSKDSGMAAYGKEEVEKAVEMGAAERLLVSEREVKRHEKLMEKAEKKGAAVTVISEEHESGQKLSKLGGLAAFLRFRIH